MSRVRRQVMLALSVQANTEENCARGEEEALRRGTVHIRHSRGQEQKGLPSIQMSNLTTEAAAWATDMSANHQALHTPSTLAMDP